MVVVEFDSRSPNRRDRDEAVAAETALAPLDLSPDAVAEPMESHQARLNQPQAIAGIVEHGLVRPLDPEVRLPEGSRVIVVAPQRS